MERVLPSQSELGRVRASLGELGILERVGESVLYRRICQLLVNEVLFGGA